MSEQPPHHAPPVTFSISDGFPAWLASINASLAFTTYQSTKLFLIGHSSTERLSIFERTLERIMGMHATPEEIHVSTRYQIWRFRDLLGPGQNFQGYDAVYTPRESHVTGDLDVHDMVVEDDGRLVFVNTLFNCLSTIDVHHSFKPLWRPTWISKLINGDRCHLNGLALRDGKARYVTAVSRTDEPDGWRKTRLGGGVLVDVTDNRVIAEGFTMPHSPRWYADKLWMLDSGTGWFGSVDQSTGEFEKLTFCPGYARGLAFLGRIALVGLSSLRESKGFEDLPLLKELKARDLEAYCGLLAIDIDSGEILHWLRMDGVVRELYDVAFLPGVRRPMAVGFKGEEICRFISVPPTE